MRQHSSTIALYVGKSTHARQVILMSHSTHANADVRNAQTAEYRDYRHIGETLCRLGPVYVHKSVTSSPSLYTLMTLFAAAQHHSSNNSMHHT